MYIGELVSERNHPNCYSRSENVDTQELFLHSLIAMGTNNKDGFYRVLYIISISIEYHLVFMEVYYI